MKKEWLRFIVCPECKGTLEFSGSGQGDIEGILYCAKAHRYPVVRGVPVLIGNDHLEEFLSGEERVSLHTILGEEGASLKSEGEKGPETKLLKKSSENWGFQWSLYDYDRTVWEEKGTFAEHIPLDCDRIRDDAAVLEIGCGRGRNIRHVKNKNNLVFAIDISESAYLAHKRYEQTENIFVVRADAARLPFKDDFFDIVFSDHALQHVYDLRVCFDEVRRVSKRSSRFIFNLYSRENNALMVHIIEPLKRAGLEKLSLKGLHFLAHFPALLLWLSLRLVYLPLHRKAPKFYKVLPLSQHMVFWLAFDYSLLRQTCFDLLQAPRSHYFSGEEIQKISEEKQFRPEKKYLLRQTLWVCDGSFYKR